jgi:hypothetical protein
MHSFEEQSSAVSINAQDCMKKSRHPYSHPRNHSKQNEKLRLSYFQKNHRLFIGYASAIALSLFVPLNANAVPQSNASSPNYRDKNRRP